VTGDQGERVTVPTLVMTGGPLDGTAYPLPVTSQQIVIGSSMDAGVQIMLGNVEPFHARLTLGAKGLSIADAGSATGTFVNGEKVQGEHPLGQGDRVCLGPPGAKGSAKLLVLLPSSGVSPSLASDAAAPSLDGARAAPSFGGEAPSLTFADDNAAEASPQFGLPVEVEGFSAEPIVADDVSGPPLEATEVAAPHEDALFSRPLPPAPPAPPLVPAPPPPPPRAAAPPPPPPPAPRAAEPEPAHRTEPAKPDYHTELPSIQVERESEPAEFPTLRPAAKPVARGKAKGKPVKRRRSFSLPSIPVVPILGGLAGLAVVGGLVWFFVLRKVPPDLASVTPTTAAVGEAVTLAGRHFRGDAASNTVMFGPLMGQVTEASATALKVLVPAGVKGQVAVVVETKGGRSGPVNVTIQAVATATALSTDVAMPGEVVLVRGEGMQGQSLSALVAGVNSPSVEATAQGAKVTIPAVPLPEGSRTQLVLQAGTTPPRTFDIYLGRLPLVIDVEPKRGAIGERVTLQGRGFRPDPLANTVTFSGQPALVLAATATELTVVAPAPPPDEVQPEQPIVVTSGGRASTSPAVYGVMRSSSAGFLPRFFAAPVPEFPGEPLAFVSTEIGPVLLLGGKAEAASTAERAVKVAVALNALVTGAQSKPPAFELRERPQPAVGLVGEVGTFLVPTPEDANAYSKNWETGRGAGRRVTQPAVARHWAALLQDYFSLFLYRQRPLKLAAISPRGKVFTEIYGEANRRAPDGPNVPTSVVLPTPASLATNLRLAALVVSGEAAAGAAVAVEGRWDGTMEDPDLGKRSFQVYMRNEGGHLAGTLTTRRGSIELKSPLRELGFDRGSVRFTADLQGTAFRFRGTLENNTVTGTIERSGKPAVPFTLQFVE
jgi:hypothetical protein